MPVEDTSHAHRINQQGPSLDICLVVENEEYFKSRSEKPALIGEGKSRISLTVQDYFYFATSLKKSQRFS